MAAEHWFRWHHGTVTDPKWRVIAARASKALSRDVTVGHVVSIWAAMLECASQANPRGELVGWCDEDVAAAFGYDEDLVREVRLAMQDKTLDGDVLQGWKRRQPKAEDGSAADRKRAQREREKSQRSEVTGSDKTACHAMSRDVTTETETETEEKGRAIPSSPATPATAVQFELTTVGAQPPAAKPADLQATRAQRLAQVTADAIEAFNASKLVKPNGGRMPSVRLSVGKDVRQKEVERCLSVAREICIESYGGPTVTPEFWADYFLAVHEDDFYSGRQGGGKGHENWKPDFELLTRRKTMLKIYDRAADEEAA